MGTTCLNIDSQPCSLAAQCASNVCTAFYVDQDGDGYGSGTAKGFCGTTAPVGYSAKNGDCCDDPDHLSIAQLIHPGADFQTSSAGGICGITWDYNCSGAVENDHPDGLCSICGGPPCQCSQYDTYPTSDCGMAVGVSECGNYGSGCSNTGEPAGTLGCR
jgi:hypothetical protein